jgi:alkanesulfonate monooxygenase SsuD/methylene tetrahydromethanopterin reductase-like flavin-dependent oxidoreductase (luciferase family)
MKFGTFHLMEGPFTKSEAQVYHEHLEQMALGDELGFDWMWLTEHHFSSVPYVPDVPGEYGLCASPFSMACAAASITKNMRIGTAIKILPLEHPLRTAEDAAMADIISNGRIDFGVGLGYRKYEFDGFRVDAGEKLERFKEALKIILGVWTTEEYEYKGKFWDVPRLTLVPRPVQKPHPPVWVATRLGTKEAIDFIVEHNYQMLSAWATRPELRGSYELLNGSRKKAGLTDPFEFTCLRHVFVAESDAEAQKLGGEYIEYYMNSTQLFRPVGEHERSEMVFGGVESCVEKIRSLAAETGVNNLICWMNFGGMPQDLVKRSMTLFAQEVMPRLRTNIELLPASRAAE